MNEDIRWKQRLEYYRKALATYRQLEALAQKLDSLDQP